MKMQVSRGQNAGGFITVALLATALGVMPAAAQTDRYQGDRFDAALVAEVEDARSQRRAGEYEEAIDALRPVVEKEPEYYLAWYNLGLAQAKFGEVGAAAESLAKALELKERFQIPDATIYNSLGWTHYLRGDYLAAKPVLEKAVVQEGLSESSRTRALNNLGTVLLRLREFDQAQDTLQRANEMGSGRAEVNLKVLDTARAVTVRQQSRGKIDRRGSGGG